MTQYEAEVKLCPACGQKNTGEFPETVTNPTQYGPNLTAFIAYLHQYQMVPFQRMAEFVSDLFSQNISEGTLVNRVKRVSEKLKGTETLIKERLLESPVLHFDETGAYVKDERQWLHSTSSDSYTHFFIHPKRGEKAMIANGVLPEYDGIAMHDCWASYFKFENCGHSICGVHLLRDLKSVGELNKQEWVKPMTKILLEAKLFSEDNAYPLPADKIFGFEKEFDQILAQGHAANPVRLKPDGKKEKNTESQRLLNRLEKRKEEIFQFLYTEEAPFDNNQAERDIRMTKVKQKVSGTFRTEQGAEDFARIRSVISTMRKQGTRILKGLNSLISGGPSPTA